MSDSRREHPISAAEWLVAGIGLVLVVGMLVVLLLDATSDEPRAPVLLVRADSVVSAAGRARVHFTVRNDGRETAADVVVAGESGGETSRATLDFVPGRSERRGTLGFRAASDRVTLWPESWREP